MKKIKITVHHSIFIKKPRELVWDFSQDYSLRSKWDKSILEAKVIQSSSPRIVELKIKGNAKMIFVYKLEDRPNKTTLAIQEIESLWFDGGGGSWEYEDKDGGTLWTQTNTLTFKSSALINLFYPIFKFVLNNQARNSMFRVKQILEKK